MFAHIFTHRFKCLVRDKQMMFWTLMFPIVLASLFGLAFGNLSSEDKFSHINIAVVDNTHNQDSQDFKSFLSAVNSAESADNTNMFNVKRTTRKEAGELLKNNKIAGYIIFQPHPCLVVRESGLNQTIIKEFLDHYIQASSSITAITQQNPQALPKLMAQASRHENYLKEVSPGKAEPDTTLNYYYALIAMACLYGGFLGLKEVSAVQANLSAQGARVSLVPVHKLKIFGSSLCAATAVHLVSIFILIAYLRLVLQIDFGSNLLYVLLACVTGSVMGVSLGALIGAIIRKDENFQIAVLIAVSMTLSFLAGLMIVDMKYIVTQAIPIMAYINPANVITDAFYSLYYYNTYSRFFANIGLMWVFSTVFYLIVYLVLRRKRYASL